MNKNLTKAMILEKIKLIRYRHILSAREEKKNYEKYIKKGEVQLAFIHYELQLEHEFVIRDLSNLLNEAGEGDNKAPW